MSHFNPLSPCGERLFEILHDRHEFHISIHSPHAGRDFGDGVGNDNVCISIHSPHAGRDAAYQGQPSMLSKFQSTLPMRGETERYDEGKYYKLFQSTLPMRGETRSGLRQADTSPFQSTLPMRGETMSFITRLEYLIFQSTLPMRGETRARLS